MAGCVGLHLALTFGTFVPSWTSYWGRDSATGREVLLMQPRTIDCDVRGHVATPACSATSFFDRAIFGQDHLPAKSFMSWRMAQCSACAPGDPSQLYRPSCEWQPDAPPWCFARMYACY